MTNTIQHSPLLMLPTCSGIDAIDVNTIIRVEAISNYSKLFFSNGKSLVVAKVLRWFEERLSIQNDAENKTLFLRTHRTHLINKNFIRRYSNGKIELCNQQFIGVARRKKSQFLQQWYCSVA
jgi:two-component system, LytTR family, response regulator